MQEVEQWQNSMSYRMLGPEWTGCAHVHSGTVTPMHGSGVFWQYSNSKNHKNALHVSLAIVQSKCANLAINDDATNVMTSSIGPGYLVDSLRKALRHPFLANK